MSAPAITDVFDCPHPCGRARLTYRACIRLQGASVVHRGGVKGTLTRWERVMHAQPYCQTCPRGAEVRAMFGVTLPKPGRPWSFGFQGGRRKAS